MSHWFIETKKQSVCFLPFENKGVIRVSLHEKQKDGIHRSDDKTLEVVLIPLTDENVKKIQSYKSVSALFKYAKANALPTQPSEPTPPPSSRPPEVSSNDDNVAIRETDGDTLTFNLDELDIISNALQSYVNNHDNGVYNNKTESHNAWLFECHLMNLKQRIQAHRQKCLNDLKEYNDACASGEYHASMNDWSVPTLDDIPECLHSDIPTSDDAVFARKYGDV